jgi:hypothetical protein
MNWKAALAYAAKANKKKNIGGHADWRLPNAKELQRWAAPGGRADGRAGRGRTRSAAAPRKCRLPPGPVHGASPQTLACLPYA